MKVRLLLHWYHEDKFTGQSFPEIEVADYSDLAEVINGKFPPEDRPIDIADPRHFGFTMPDPWTPGEAGMNFSIRIMQVIIPQLVPAEQDSIPAQYGHTTKQFKCPPSKQGWWTFFIPTKKAFNARIKKEPAGVCMRDEA